MNKILPWLYTSLFLLVTLFSLQGVAIVINMDFDKLCRYVFSGFFFLVVLYYFKSVKP
ncbi:MAG TPA: hypothetical protein VD794_08985 [Flavisolibacter sp.]|nr:hypothetical protein [Flavisolibacter sp.]